jgi:protein involved in polysaccharide export with SLBB domain
MRVQGTISILALLLLLLSGLARGQEATPTPPPDPDVKATTKITPGCVLSVTVTDEPDLSGSFTVDDAGEIKFTLSDAESETKEEWNVVVKDKTTDEAKTAIADSMKKYLRAPEVTVVLVKLPRIKVEVVGPALKPGSLELRPGSRLSDALLLCGSKPNADLANIRILRRAKKEGEKPQTLAVDFEAFSSGASDEDPELQAGDRIVLTPRPVQAPVEEVRYVRVVGEVNREVQHPLSKGLRVRDLLERAGGLKPTADRTKMRLVRGTDGKVLDLDADRVEADDPVYNLPLSPNDLIIVGVRDQSLVFAVIGEVVQPSTFPWNASEKMTLLTAIERAGGLTKQADAKKGLLRKNFLRNPVQPRDLPFDLDQIKKGKMPDWEIEPGDTLLIPTRQRRPNFFQQIMPLLFRFLPFGI